MTGPSPTAAIAPPLPAAAPRVSVIVPAYNAMPELTRCITSAMEQTLGLERIEIIAVDDGSTDGTGAELDRLARDCPALRVVHQENSGGAGGPRNTGLDLARGDFVFFLDSDDYLGPDALRRMVAMADENGTDVVLGKMVSVGGRAVPTAVFRHNQPRTDIFTSAAYRTLGPWKLFRRSLIERLRLRFPPYRNCEDKPFTAAAYLNADGISVVADYDCYYVRNRENGNNLTRVASDLVHRMDGTRLCFETVARYLEPGPRRDRIMRRHVEWELCGPLRALLPREDEEDARTRFFPEFRHWARTWANEDLCRQLDAPDRLLIHLLRADRFEELLTVARNAKEDARRGHLVDKGRVYWLHPLFRDPAAAIPDACFDVTDRLPAHQALDTAGWQGDGVLRVTGHAYIEHVATLDPETELILRMRDADRPDIRVPTTACAAPSELPGDGMHREAGFTADIDLASADGGAPLGRGIWDLFVDVRAQGVSRTVRLRHRRTGVDAAAERTAPPPRMVDKTAVTPFFTPYGNFSLDVGRVLHGPALPCAITEVRWAPSEQGRPGRRGRHGRPGSGGRQNTLAIGGRLTGDAAGSAAECGPPRLRAVHESGAVREEPARYGAKGSGPAFSACLPVAALRPGRWTVTLVQGDGGQGGEEMERSAAVPRPARLSGTRWFRFGRPYYAKPLVRGPEAALVLEVAPVRVGVAVRRRLARLRHRLRQ